MLSKNNYHEKLRKMEPRKERFSIRKFSIGAASVLIGFSFMSMAGNQKVQAATEENPVVVNNAKNNEQQSNDIQQNVKIDEANKATDAEKVNPTTTSSQNSTDSKLTQSPAQDSKNALKDATSEVKQDNQATQPESSTTSKEATEVKTDAAKEDTTKTAAVKNNDISSSVASLNSVSDQKTTNFNVKANVDNVNKQNKTSLLKSSLVQTSANASQGQTQEVSDWNSFGAALISPNVGNIVLTNDITANGSVANAINDNYGELDVTAKDIARQVTIDGQGKYALNFGTNFLAFTNANQGDNNSAWDLTLKDLTVNGDGYQRTIYGGGYGTFYFGNVNTTNGQKDTITLDGVTANIKQGPFIAGASHAALDVGAYKSVINVVLKGDNTINNNGVNADNSQNVNYGSTIQTGNLTVESGTTTMNVGTYKTNNMANPGGNMIEADLGNVTINEGATLNLNAKALDDAATTTDVKGIVTGQFLNGSVTVNGNLNANMGAGHSSAIITGDMTISKSGSVAINTKQDNNGVAFSS